MKKIDKLFLFIGNNLPVASNKQLSFLFALHQKQSEEAYPRHLWSHKPPPPYLGRTLTGILHTMEKRLMMRSACLLSVKNARQQRFLYVSKLLLSSPPMVYTKSGVRTKGAHSRLKPWIFGGGGLYSTIGMEVELFLGTYHAIFDVSEEVAKVYVE